MRAHALILLSSLLCLYEGLARNAALIISGGIPTFSGPGELTDIPDSVGNSVEVFVPSTGQHCQLPVIPGDPRYYHTMEGRTVCGGRYSTSTSTSCLTLKDGGWETSTTLLEERVFHSSWSSPSNLTILMGGGGSPNTTVIIMEDGTSARGFDLEYGTREACAISTGYSVLITGGENSLTEVVEYSESGPTWKYLPQLLQGRYLHGCSSYENDEGTKTFLVTGGINGRYDRLSSTELLRENATTWVVAGELPSPRFNLRLATVDSRVLATGGFYYDSGGDLTDILEFSPSTGEWSQLDRMLEARAAHAISSIPFSEAQAFCSRTRDGDPFLALHNYTIFNLK